MSLFIQTISTAIFTIIGAFLFVVLTRLLRQNGRAINDLGNKLSELIKTESQNTRQLMQEIDKRHTEIFSKLLSK
ncbi:MAG: hypothetical protein QMD71_09520 [bacterium]|nr:hypothetical protein [bacterium]